MYSYSYSHIIRNQTRLANESSLLLTNKFRSHPVMIPVCLEFHTSCPVIMNQNQNLQKLFQFCLTETAFRPDNLVLFVHYFLHNLIIISLKNLQRTRYLCLWRQLNWIGLCKPKLFSPISLLSRSTKGIWYLEAASSKLRLHFNKLHS